MEAALELLAAFFSVVRKMLQWNPVWFEWAHLYL
jgi:hypothetical protein